MNPDSKFFSVKSDGEKILILNISHFFPDFSAKPMDSKNIFKTKNIHGNFLRVKICKKLPVHNFKQRNCLIIPFIKGHNQQNIVMWIILILISQSLFDVNTRAQSLQHSRSKISRLSQLISEIIFVQKFALSGPMFDLLDANGGMEINAFQVIITGTRLGITNTRLIFGLGGRHDG